MSNPWNWTVTFHPVRALSRLCVLSVVMAACYFPYSGARDIVHVTPVVTVEQMKQTTALAAVQNILDERMPNLAPERRVQLAKTVVDESLACGLDPLFSLAIADVESRKGKELDHEAVSAVIGRDGRPKANAKGLFQVIDQTWNAEVKRRGLQGAERFNPVDSAKVGIGYLCSLAQGFKRPDSLLMAYNQGPAAATAILKGQATGDYQVPIYAPAVWKSYKGMLARLGLPNDAKTMRTLYKAPDQTIYVVALERANDAKGGDGKGRDPTAPLPVKVKKAKIKVVKPKPAPAPEVVKSSAGAGDVPVHGGIQPAQADPGPAPVAEKPAEQPSSAGFSTTSSGGLVVGTPGGVGVDVTTGAPHIEVAPGLSVPLDPFGE